MELPAPPDQDFGGRRQAPRSEGRVRLQSRGMQALEQGRARLIVTAAMFSLAFSAVGLRLVDATIFAHGPEVANQANRVPEVTLPQTRADIQDRNGVLLATSLATASLYADPKLVIDPADAAKRITELLPDVNRERLLADLKGEKRFVWIRRNLTPRQEYEVNRLGLPGLFFQREERRIYPQGALMAHVVGFTSVDNTGLSGVERSQDARLREGGAPLQLSIDVRLQHILRREIQAQIDDFTAIGGAGMIFDVRTGEVVAMVSLPDFDPQEPGEADDANRFNRDTLGVYEIGSVFKIFNTAMALDAGAIKLSDSFDTHPLHIGRFTITDYHPQNRAMSVPEIFKESSNIGSVHIAERVGIDGQRAFLGKLGLFKPAKLELPEVGWPLLPNPWSHISLMTVAYGHGIAVSPIQAVTGVAAIVNGGILRPATLLKQAEGQDVPGTRVIRQETSDVMRRLMRLVVTEGTAKQSEAPGYLLGGKTGTAEKATGHGYAKKALLSSFYGAFPMNDPRYVVVVMVDEPKGNKKSYGFATAGWVAAPAVSRIVQQIGPLLGVRPVDSNSPEVQQALSLDPAHLPRLLAAKQ
jgi:cell division protein FtsI (penicillin-binding protein 3)